MAQVERPWSWQRHVRPTWRKDASVSAAKGSEHRPRTGQATNPKPPRQVHCRGSLETHKVFSQRRFCNSSGWLAIRLSDACQNVHRERDEASRSGAAAKIRLPALLWYAFGGTFCQETLLSARFPGETAGSAGRGRVRLGKRRPGRVLATKRAYRSTVVWL